MRAFLSTLPASLMTAALLSTSLATQAAVPMEQWQALNQNIVSQHILPGYEQLARSSEQLQKNTEQFCSKPDQAGLQQVQTQYKATLQAWQGIQHVTFGPIELLMRHNSLQFWPDKKNLTSRQLKALLQQQDPAALTPESMQSASIAVKGLPALERVLFEEQALREFQKAPYRCDYLQAVSGYLVTQTSNTFKEWQEYQQEYSYLSSEEGVYEDAQAASIDLMKAQVEPLEVVRDLKILRPLGQNNSKPRRLESWRSLQSLANLQSNIRSLHHMYSGIDGLNLQRLLAEQGLTGVATRIEIDFDTIEQQLSQVPGPLYTTLKQADTQQQLGAVAQRIQQLHGNLEDAMIILELQLGFNSRDGD